MDLCRIDECLEPAGRGGLCACHRKRLQRGLPMRMPKRERGAALIQRFRLAALEYAHAESDEDYQRADRRLARLIYRVSRLRLRIRP